MTSDQARLAQCIDTWSSTIQDTVALLRSLEDAAWSKPTDLPGWDVHAVAAHLAHLESELAGFDQTPVEVPELEHIRSPMGAYTEMGPLARASWTPGEVVDELEKAASSRLAELRETPPTDPQGKPPITPGGIGWSWETLLRNRPLDVWMHQQDIRRAVGRPGGMDSAGAQHTTRVLSQSFAYAVGKKVAPPAGTTVLLDVHGEQQVHQAIEVNLDGRAVPMSRDPDHPSVRLTMDVESFTILGGGRRSPDYVVAEVVGDEKLGRRILEAMAVTP